MKDRIQESVNIPSTGNDVVYAFVFTFVAVALYASVFQYVGCIKKLDNIITSFFGAIIAFSGIMNKQYLFKETIDYLLLWNNTCDMISNILVRARSEGKDQDPLIVEFKSLLDLSESYVRYIKRELVFIPVIPVLLIVLYGFALISSESLIFRCVFLSLMLWLVAYLALATISTHKLQLERPEVEKMVTELQKELQDIS